MVQKYFKCLVEIIMIELFILKVPNVNLLFDVWLKGCLIHTFGIYSYQNCLLLFSSSTARVQMRCLLKLTA